MTEGVFPKVDGDVLYASEVNGFNNSMVYTGNIASMVPNQIRYVPPMGRISTPTGTEAEVQMIVPRSGKISNLYAKPGTNTSSINLPLIIRINGVDTAVKVTFPAGDSSQQTDIINTATVSAGDLISLRWISSAGTGSITNAAFGFLLEAN